MLPIVNAIQIKDLSKVYRSPFGKPTRALQGVTFETISGHIFGLLGPNGAGKTTLVKILVGLCHQSGGTVRILGELPGTPRIRQNIGYLPELINPPEYMKAKDMLRYIGRLNSVNEATLCERIPHLLSAVGLANVQKPIREFSKGMKQRLGVAQALVNDPEIVFLDEPTDGLDPIGRRDIRDLLGVLKKKGKTVFLNSHLLSEVESLCDEIAILKDGHLIRIATHDEFTRRTGAVRIRLNTLNEAVYAAVKAATDTAVWEGTTFMFTPRDKSEIHEMIERLRAVAADVEAVEHVSQSLEEYFFDAIQGASRC